jgi:hypothetical protein
MTERRWWRWSGAVAVAGGKLTSTVTMVARVKVRIKVDSSTMIVEEVGEATGDRRWVDEAAVVPPRLWIAGGRCRMGGSSEDREESDEETDHKEQVETKGEAARSHSHKKKEGDRSHGQLNGTVTG